MDAHRLQGLRVSGHWLKLIQRVRACQREDTSLRSAQAGQVRSAAQVAAKLVRDRPHIASSADLHCKISHIAVDFRNLEALDHYGGGLQLDRLSSARQFVRRSARDLL